MGIEVKMPRQGGRGRRRKFADDGWTDSEDESTTQDEDTEGPSPSKRVKGAVTKAPSTGTLYLVQHTLRKFAVPAMCYCPIFGGNLHVELCLHL